MNIKHLAGNYFLLFFCLLFLSLTPVISYSQNHDSFQVSSNYSDTFNQNQVDNYHEEYEEDFSPGLALMVLLLIGFMFICIGVGIVLTVIGLLVLFGLIGAGILSASILIGLHKKSFEKGFKTFIVLGTSASGLFIGSLGFWILNKILHWFPTKTAILIGSVGGLLTGLLLGLLVSYVIRKLTAFLKDKLKTRG